MNFLKIVSERKLKGGIAEIEEETGEMFAGLEVSFKDNPDDGIWLNSDLIKIERPQLVKKVEEYLKKITRVYRNNNSEEEHSTQHTSLTKWTKEGDSND